MDQPVPDVPPAPQPNELAWSVSPWTRKAGPVWRNPVVALTTIIAISLLCGYALNVPNYPRDFIDTLEVRLAEPPEGIATEQLEIDRKQLADIKHHLEVWPYRMLGWAGVSFLLLFGMTATLFLPVRYKLDAKGVTVYFLGAPSHRSWEHYRNFYVHDTGVHLTTMPKPSGLDPFRGHYLQYSGNKKEVVAYIKEHMVLRGQPEAR